MRIGLLGDIHANLPGLEAAWRQLSAAGFDLAVCTGDLVHFGPYASEVIGFVRDHDLACVQGNCDRAVGRGREETGDTYPNRPWERDAASILQWTRDILSEDEVRYLRQLPEELRFSVGRAVLLVTHGVPGRISVGFEPGSPVDAATVMLEQQKADIIALGHTHEPLLQTCDRGWVLNPGSVGGGSQPGAATFAILEMDEEAGRSAAAVAWFRTGFDMDRYARRFRECGLPELILRCIETGRDPRGPWHTTEHRWRQRWAGR